METEFEADDKKLESVGLLAETPGHSVFLSHSSQDAAIAQAVCAYLESAGIKCWLAPRDVMAGRPYGGQITEAIRSAQVFLLVLGKESNRSKQVLREVERAVHCQIHLLTFRIEKVEPNDDLAYFLGVDHWLDAVPGPPDVYHPALFRQTLALLQPSSNPNEDIEADAAPETFAHFRILRKPDGSLERLGKGGMGVTWKAVDIHLDRPVALKVIGADLLSSVSARQRFLREAQAAAKIHHPHVATVYQFGQEGDAYFYAMQFVEGEDLERYVARHGPLSPALALRVALQAAQALEAAQLYHLVHRDIKPANLMATINRDGNIDIKLIDFGLAKGISNKDLDLTKITRSQDFVGSPAFASPEQCEMGELDTRSDIYSLGVTLWYLLSGKRPFSGTVGQVLIAHAVKPPPFDQLNSVPEPVIALLQRMLAKNPEERPQNPQQLQAEMEAVAARLAAEFGTVSERISGEAMPAAMMNVEPGRTPPIPSPLFDPYLKIETGGLIAGRYLLVEEEREGIGGRLFLAEDRNAGRAEPSQVALKILHPGLSGDSVLLDLLGNELGVIKNAPHPSVIRYFSLERNQENPFLVREWVHGFLLYDLLRWRGSLAATELKGLLGPLAASVDFVSQNGFGLVEVSTRKILVTCPLELHPGRFAELGRKDVREWAGCELKLNPLSLAPLLYRYRVNRPQQTLVPTSQVLSLTQAEAGIQGTKAVRLFGRLVYQLLSGHPPTAQADRGQYTPLPELNEAGNVTLRRALVVTKEPVAYKTCTDFWTALRSDLDGRTALPNRKLPAPPISSTLPKLPAIPPPPIQPQSPAVPPPPARAESDRQMRAVREPAKDRKTGRWLPLILIQLFPILTYLENLLVGAHLLPHPVSPEAINLGNAYIVLEAVFFLIVVGIVLVRWIRIPRDWISWYTALSLLVLGIYQLAVFCAFAAETCFGYAEPFWVLLALIGYGAFPLLVLNVLCLLRVCWAETGWRSVIASTALVVSSFFLVVLSGIVGLFQIPHGGFWLGDNGVSGSLWIQIWSTLLFGLAWVAPIRFLLFGSASQKVGTGIALSPGVTQSKRSTRIATLIVTIIQAICVLTFIQITVVARREATPSPTPTPESTPGTSPTPTPSPTVESTTSPGATPTADQSANTYIDRAHKEVEKGNYQAAIADYTEAIRLKPDDADTYNHRGIAYTNVMQSDKAISDFTEAIRLKADYAVSYGLRGIAYGYLHQYDKAISDYNRAIQLNPNQPFPYNYRGIAYDDLKQDDKAISDYNQAIQLKPDYAEAYNNRGYAYYHLKQYDQAIRDYTQCIRLKPNFVQAYNNRANAYDALGETAKAKQDRTKAKELGANH